jgi:2-phospho-L-lactate guanylyltransferase (CobY/MobA/RfbA family)
LAASYDGGTTAFLGTGTASFSYGPASVHRHIVDNTAVISTEGLSLDIDRPDDLVAAQAHERGAWLGATVDGSPDRDE